MYAQFERFEIKMTKAQADSVSHQGKCDADVAYLLQNKAIKAQLSKISDEALRDELREYGAWDEAELADRAANEARIIWIAGGNIMESAK